MYNYHNKKKFICSILLMLLLAIGIGYAYLTSNLSISGNTNVSTNTWNIHFENISIKDGSVTATTSPTLSNNNTSITYTIDLNRPKEYYEFTVDVKNDGTLPGKVSISTLNGITSDAAPIIDYTIAYTNGNPVSIGDILNAGAKKSIKVRVFYKDEIDPTDFPSNDLNLTLTYTLQYVQSEEDEFDTSALIEQLKTNSSSCFTKYEGEVTDQPGETVTANNVYFNKCADKRNIIFGGYCWQMIRTTETGGIKVIYNGETSGGKCASERGDHIGIIGARGSSSMINSEYLYSSSFTYDKTNNSFTLIEPSLVRWSNITYQSLVGKYTCKNTTGICTTIYNVNAYSSNQNAYVATYTIGDTNYAQIGTSVFNSNYFIPSFVGYMFNNLYKVMGKTGSTINDAYKFGSTFTYDTNTNLYTLSGTTQDISSWSTGYNQINNTHYTCWNTSGTCSTISYVLYAYYVTYDNKGAHYLEISDGKSIDDILTEILSSNDVNRYNSSIKGIVDNWYAQNLSSKTNMLEDTVYCNSRNIANYGGWIPNGGSTSSALFYKNKNLTTDLSCVNSTDQFAVSNNRAKLIYPIGLISSEEFYNIGGNTTEPNNLRKTGEVYWLISPSYILNNEVSHVRTIANGGSLDSQYVDYAGGIRPVVSLASSVVISEGTGSETDPWVIE